MVDRVELDGFGAVLAKLASLPAAAQREVDEVIRGLVVDNAAKIRAGAPAAGRQAARAAQSVHAEGSAIVGGGPYFLGSVFGGQGRPTTQQFKLWRPESYWFMSTLADNFEETMRRFESVVDVIAREWDR